MTDAYDYRADTKYMDYLGTLDPRKRRRAKKRTLASGQPYYYGAEPTSGFGDQYSTTMPNSTLNPTQLRGSDSSGSQGSLSTNTSRFGTNPSTFDADVSNAALLPYPGSAATGYAGVGKVPDAMQMAAGDPYLQADVLVSDRFGLPAGSRSAGLLGAYLGGTEARALALGAYQGLDSNADWINFGASLMNSSALQQNGAQLNPKTMIQTLVQGALKEFDATKSGGPGTGSEYSPLAALASMNPAEGIDKFISIIKGALSGTMPEDQLTGYTQWLAKAAQQFVTGYVTGKEGSVMEQESQGRNWLSALVQRLGPSLGL